VLSGARAGKQTERGLYLTKNRRLTRRKPHVAREHELAAGAACSALNLRDANEAACAQTAKQERERRFSRQLRRLLAVLFDPRQVDVRYEIVRVSALEHEYLDGVVGLGALNEGDEIANEFRSEKIHGGSRNFRE
jgi:hypothetical protein